MSGKADFVHVGLTVASIDKTVDFYTKYLNFELMRRGQFGAGFIAAQPALYRQKEEVYADNAFLKSPNGFVLELFQFSDMLPEQEQLWNRPGYHHICVIVEDLPGLYKRMAADGVEFFFEPGAMGPPENNHHWVFLKDPDGNMIELQD